MNKAYKYRLYPTEEQKLLFGKTFGCCRLIWNTMLSDKISFYKDNKQTLHNTPAQYKTDYPFLKEVDSLALANVQLNLQGAYNSFFTKLKSHNKKPGFPKFKSKHHCHNSYTTNNQKGSISIGSDYIKLPKIGKVPAVIHRLAPAGYVLKSATISMERDGSYYCSILYEYEANIITVTVTPDTVIGLDYKSNGFYVDSNGNTCGSPKCYRKAQKRLTKAQRKLRHQVIGSNNYNKQQLKVSKVHRKTVNQRNDFLNKKSLFLANQYSLVCVEDLDMRAQSNKGFGNGKATLDNSWGRFLQMLEYKLSDRGKTLIKVSKWYPSSQLCYSCGYKNPITKDLSVRTITCPICSKTYDRDENAALNIRDEGYRLYLQSIKKTA